jgi:hypothetical protein
MKPYLPKRAIGVCWGLRVFGLRKHGGRICLSDAEV